MRIRLLHPLGNYPIGEVIEKDDHRAHRLIQMGYAVAEPDDTEVVETKERGHAHTKSHRRDVQ